MGWLGLLLLYLVRWVVAGEKVWRGKGMWSPSVLPPPCHSLLLYHSHQEECGLIRGQCLLKETSSALCNVQGPLVRQEREDRAEPTSFSSHQFYAPLELA